MIMTLLLPEGDRDHEVAGFDGLATQTSRSARRRGRTTPRPGQSRRGMRIPCRSTSRLGQRVRCRPIPRRRRIARIPVCKATSIAPDEVGRDAELLESVEIERRLSVGRHQEVDGGRPRLRVVRGASAVEELVPRDLPLGRHRRAGTVRLRRPDQPSGSTPAGSDRERSKCRRVGQDGRVCRT